MKSYLAVTLNYGMSTFRVERDCSQPTPEIHITVEGQRVSTQINLTDEQWRGMCELFGSVYHAEKQL